jgi:urease accessory protein
MILQDVTPGLFPGDRLEIDVLIDDDAALTVCSQGATRVYPSPTGIASELRTSLTVGRGGTLWWLPGAVIPFRDARYVAQTTVTVAAGARFALMEVVTPGRVAMGERDRYGRLDLRLRIESGGAPLLIERAMLDPLDRPPEMAGRRGRFACFGSLITIGYQLPAIDDDDSQDLWLGADGGCDLAVVRGLATSVAPLQSALRAVLQQADAMIEHNRQTPV